MRRRRLFLCVSLLFLGLVTVLALMRLRARQDLPPDVLLIVVDTLRADKVTPELTPHIEKAAREGVRCLNAICQTPYTSPSHASLLTGTYPSRHGVLDNAQELPDLLPTWASILSNAGYECAAFVSGYPLLSRFGLGRSFSHYDDQMGSPGSPPPFEYIERPGEATTEAARIWLNEHRGQAAPLFLWMHYFDPHSPYQPPAEHGQGRSPYDGEVHYADDAVGELLSAFKECRGSRPAFIIITSDHGESLGEHGEQEHSLFLYQATVHVPLTFIGPGIPRGRIMEDLCQTIDILPTVLDCLGLQHPDTLQGISLKPAFSGKPLARSLAYSETFSSAMRFGWSELRCWIQWPWKYISGPSPELYRLDQDPRELKDLAALESDRCLEMKASLYAHDASKTALPPVSGQLSEEDERRMKALSYLVGRRRASMSDIPPEDRSPKPGDPKSMLSFLAGLDQAMEEIQAGRFPEAQVKLRDLLGMDPENPEILCNLGEIAREMKDYAGSVALFDQVLASRPEDLKAWVGKAIVLRLSGRYAEASHAYQEALSATEDGELYNGLGACLEMDAKEDQALIAYEKATKSTPSNAFAWFNLGRLSFKISQDPQAISKIQRSIDLKPDFLEAYAELGQVQIALKNWVEAEKTFSKGLQHTGDQVPLLNGLGIALAQQGKMEQAKQAWQRSLNMNPNQETVRQWISEER